MYIASTERLCQLFNQIWEEAVFPAWQQSFGRTPAFVSRGPIHHNSYGALLQDWVYLKKPYSPCDDNNWHFAWGIAFPQVGGYWWEDAEPQLPSRTYTFVYLWYEEKNPPLPEISPDILGKLGSGWSVSASDGNCLIKARAMCEFDPDPDRLAEQMIAWIKESAEQLKRVIMNIR
jgi:hypothetical protein